VAVHSALAGGGRVLGHAALGAALGHPGPTLLELRLGILPPWEL